VSEQPSGPTADPVAAPRHLVLLLASFTSLVVLTTDVYLPVLPRLGADLATSSAAAAATLSTLLVGVAGGQILVGPLSDAFGRRLPLLLGGISYALTHLSAAFAPNIGTLLVLRLLAGLATAACIVTARAIVADVYPGLAAARAFATLGAVTAIAPVVAPVAGGALAHVMTWRGMFVLLAVLALALTAVGWRVLPETLPPERRTAPHPVAVVRDLGTVLGGRRFLAYACSVAALGGVLFGYIGASSFVLQDGFGLSPQAYSLVFAANSVGIFAVSNLNRHLVGRIAAARLLAVGHLVGVLGVVTLGLGVALASLPVVLAGLFVTIASVGLVMPSSTALAMAAEPARLGSASGVLGISQFTAGAVASPLAGAGGSPWSFVAVLGVSAVAGPVLVRIMLSADRRG
jgi:DHA1 family bicyclomycin/chloramphenicol resistance-like MFS transporter